MMDTLDVIKELKYLEKYTIVYFGRDGWPISLNFKMMSIEDHSKNTVLLTMKPNLCSVKKIFLNPVVQFVIWNDWVHPDVEIIIGTYMKDSGHCGVMKMARTWARFDPRYLTKAKDSVEAAAMIWNIHEPRKEEFYDLCYI